MLCQVFVDYLCDDLLYGWGVEYFFCLVFELWFWYVYCQDCCEFGEYVVFFEFVVVDFELMCVLFYLGVKDFEEFLFEVLLVCFFFGCCDDVYE